MGKLIYPDWDERHRKRSQGRANKIYLGYGYFLVHYQDGSKEIEFDPNVTSITLGKFVKFTEKGFPVYSHGDE